MVDEPYAELDALLAGAVARGAAPGLVAMVANGGRVLHAGCAGLRNREPAEAMRIDTVFWIASLTKLVTAIAALQAVERGLLDLDGPIDPLLPDLAGYQVLTGFAADGTPMLRPPARPITLRHLLSHTSGLSLDLIDPVLLRARGEAGATPPHRRLALRGPLRCDPGEGWHYGVSSDWAGLAIEVVSGRTLGAWFAAEIFGPLQMRDSGFEPPPARQAMLYQRAGADGFIPIPTPVDERGIWEYDAGGGGLFSTAGDYVRLLRMLLNRGLGPAGRVLGEPMVELLFRPQTGRLRAGALPAAPPGTHARFDLFPEMASGWSLGGMVNPQAVAGGRRTGSLGWAGWANTYYWVDRDADLCAVVMAQFLPFADPSMIAAVRAVESSIYATLAPHM